MWFTQDPTTIPDVRSALDSVFMRSFTPDGEGERWVLSGEGWVVLCYVEQDDDEDDVRYMLVVDARIEYERVIQHIWPVMHVSPKGVKIAVDCALRMARGQAQRELMKLQAAIGNLPLDK